MNTQQVKWRDVAATAIEHHKAQQLEGELTALLCLLAADVKPKVVLEIGSADGGSAWAWSNLPSVEMIIGVDLNPPDLEKCVARDGVTTMTVRGNSLDPGVIAMVAAACIEYPPDMVFIDGCHDLGSATSDLAYYGQMCQRGGVIVMHDTQGWPGRDDFQVGQVYQNALPGETRVELVSQPGGPAGTGIIWVTR